MKKHIKNLVSQSISHAKNLRQALSRLGWIDLLLAGPAISAMLFRFL
jgi:hypothetical protein